MPFHSRTSLALGAALLGSIAAPAFAMTDLAQGYALGASGQTPPAEQKDAGKQPAPAAAPAKHAEGKCGSDHAAHAPAAAKAADSKAVDAKAGEVKAHAEGKCGEGKCGGNH